MHISLTDENIRRMEHQRLYAEKNWPQDVDEDDFYEEDDEDLDEDEDEE